MKVKHKILKLPFWALLYKVCIEPNTKQNDRKKKQNIIRSKVTIRLKEAEECNPYKE